MHVSRKTFEHSHPVGLLQPLPIPDRKWESVSMEFIMGLPKSQRKDNIFAVFDRLTKYAHFFTVLSIISASEVAALFFKDIFKLHGLPKVIISDRDSKFTSAFWQTLFGLVETNLNMSTSYHPQTYGKTERVNQWIEGYLRNYVTRQQGDWETWIHLGELFYNTIFHISTRMTPFMALYGNEAPNFVGLIFGDCRAQKMKYWLQ